MKDTIPVPLYKGTKAVNGKEPAFSLIELLTNIVWSYPKVMKWWAIINIAIFVPIDVYAFIRLPGHTFYQPVLEAQMGMLILAVLRLGSQERQSE